MQTELYTIQGVENILTPALIYYKDEIIKTKFSEIPARQSKSPAGQSDCGRT